MTTESRNPRTDDERFAGLLGAWDDENPLPYVMRAFADSLAVEYRGWAEVIRGWAHRLDREDRRPTQIDLEVSADLLSQYARDVKLGPTGRQLAERMAKRLEEDMR